MNIAFLQNKSTKISKTITINEALNDILDEVYGDRIKALRATKKADDRAYKVLKGHLPAWSFGCTYDEKGIKTENIKQSSGLLHFDIDHTIVELTKKLLVKKVPSLLAVWESPGGDGLKGVIKLKNPPQSALDYKALYKAFIAEMLEIGVTVDKSCRDMRRLCFVCSDPYIYINYDCDDWYPKPSKKEEIKAKHTELKAESDQAIAAGTENAIYNRIVGLINNAMPGEYHYSRLRAGELAGGYVASGQITQEYALSALRKASEAVSLRMGDTEEVMRRELQACADAFRNGLTRPIDEPAVKPKDAVNTKALPDSVLSERPPLIKLKEDGYFINDNNKGIRYQSTVVESCYNLRDLRAIYAGKLIDVAWSKNKVNAVDAYMTGHEDAPDIYKIYSGAELFADSASNKFNLWSGIAFTPKRDDEAIRGFLAHIKRISDGDEGLQDWIECWLAHAVQYPGEKPKTALVCYGEDHGAGKSIIGEIMASIFGKHSITLSSADDLAGAFNGHLSDKIWVQSEEAVFSGSHKMANKMKDTITSDSILINNKGFCAYRAKNYMKLYITTNSLTPVHIEPGDRRYTLCHVKFPEGYDTPQEAQKAMRAEVEKWQHKSERFLSAVVYWLFNKRLTSDIKTAYLNKNKQDVIAECLAIDDTKERWLSDNLESEGESYFVCDGREIGSTMLYNNYLQYCEKSKLKPDSQTAFGRWLSKKPFVSYRIASDKTKARFYSISSE